MLIFLKVSLVGFAMFHSFHLKQALKQRHIFSACARKKEPRLTQSHHANTRVENYGDLGEKKYPKFKTWGKKKKSYLHEFLFLLFITGYS